MDIIMMHLLDLAPIWIDTVYVYNDDWHLSRHEPGASHSHRSNWLPCIYQKEYYTRIQP